MIYEVYGKLHQLAKKMLQRSSSEPSYRMVSINDDDFNTGYLIEQGDYINEYRPAINISKKQIYPLENVVPYDQFPTLKDSFRKTRICSEKQLGVSSDVAEKTWLSFVEKSIIPTGFRNEQLHYAGYILDDEQWCLPSWIWTNAAVVRLYCNSGQIEKAKKIADLLISLQNECGGWIVRCDYDDRGAIPVLAPNDSAYLANNCCLEVYLATGILEYFSAAEKCAEWIIDTARDDGMVLVGYNTRDNCWQTNHNIVDVGFTAGLFARLYQITHKNAYLNFLKTFTDRYIELFYKPSSKGFATSLDANDHQIGGMFGRGQAWALEGIIPAYEVLQETKLKRTIDDTVSTLLRAQLKTGGWAYNLSRPLMGIDCKATSVIALSLMKWGKNKETISAARKALKWLERHTSTNGESAGGIFSYTTEGAIVHHMYSWTAFVYASVYAIELKRMINDCDMLK